jgi:hypothetical protein
MSQYRELNPSETVRAGDQYWSGSQQRWRVMDHDATQIPGGKYRRPVDEATDGMTPIERLVYDTIKDSPRPLTVEDIAFAIEGEHRKSTIKTVARTVGSLMDDGSIEYDYCPISGEVRYSEIQGQRETPEPEDQEETKTDDEDEYFTGEDGKQYRMLKVGEVLRSGDQIELWSGKWVPSFSAGYHENVKVSEAGQYRRPVESVPPKPLPENRYMIDNGNYYRILRKDEEVAEGDECRITDDEKDSWDKSSKWASGKQAEYCTYRRPLKEAPAGLPLVEALFGAILGKDWTSRVIVNG